VYGACKGSQGKSKGESEEGRCVRERERDRVCGGGRDAREEVKEGAHACVCAYMRGKCVQ